VSFAPDNVQGAALAVEHLLALGRQRIAHVTGPRYLAPTLDRVEGMTQALTGAGVTLLGEPLHGDWSARWGRHGAAMLLSSHPDVDAIFCGSDRIAAGVLDTLRESGRAVPRDVAVVGFDNWEVVAADARVPLTTVDMNLQELGRTAARQLFSAMEGPPQSGVRRQDCRLVIRQSTEPG
jgi:LacI family transcriptional regulator